jgi:endonuclease-3
VVDTHVQRISQRLGWTSNTEPEKIETDLCAILPRHEWAQASHVLIFHGRRCCFARKPDCAGCSVNDTCPAAFDAEHVGRKTLVEPARAKKAKTEKKRNRQGAGAARKTAGKKAKKGKK